MPLENEYGALALESTLDALKTLTDSLLVAANAIQVATEGLNAKAFILDTAHVAGSVDVDNFPATQPVSGTVAVSNMVSQGLTDTQLRATAVQVSGSVSVNNQPSQPLTDAQLRAADVKVSLDGEQVSVSNFPENNELTVDQLREKPVLVKIAEIEEDDQKEFFELQSLLGSNSLVGEYGGLKAEVSLRQSTISGVIRGANSEVKIDSAYTNTVGVQLSQTWAGTITFQCSINGADFVSVAALPVGGGSVVSTATTNGAWKIDCSTFKYVRVVFTTYTSGACFATLTKSAATLTPNSPTSQTTADSQIPTILGATQLYRQAITELDQQIVAPITAPTQPTTYADNKFARYPQRYRRLRVEAAGDQGIPLAQEQYTNKLLVSIPDMYSKIEQMLLQQVITNTLLTQGFKIPPIEGMDKTLE